MIKASSLSSGVRNQHVLVWGTIVWLMSAVRVASDGMELEMSSKRVVSNCGENVTLSCHATSSHLTDMRSFSWVGRNKSLCNDSYHDPEVLCERSTETTHIELKLTLINVMPVHQGKYFCKVYSRKGIKNNSSTVAVQDCLKHSGSKINGSHAECWFNGVYPSGSVHWFQGDVNLTEFASTKEDLDQYGRYNIISTMKLNASLESYDCLLWIHDTGTYVSTKQLPVVKGQTVLESNGSIVKLHWICMMVEIMMLRFMM